MRPLKPITLITALIFIGTLSTQNALSCWQQKCITRIELPKLTGATIGQITLGTPQNGITETGVTKKSIPSFMVTSSDLRTLEKAFHELKITIQLYNKNGVLAGTAQLTLIINGKRNPPKANNIATLDTKIPKGTYQVVIKIFYWTAPITHEIQDRFFIHVIPKAAQAG